MISFRANMVGLSPIKLNRDHLRGTPNHNQTQQRECGRTTSASLSCKARQDPVFGFG